MLSHNDSRPILFFFVQHVTFESFYALYTNFNPRPTTIDLDFAEQGETYLDSHSDAEAPWVTKNLLGSFFDASAGKTYKEIIWSDTPKLAAPLKYRGLTLESLKISLDFTTDVAAQTIQTGLRANQSYFRQATFSWSFGGKIILKRGGKYVTEGARVELKSGKQWDTNIPSPFVESTDGPIANDLLDALLFRATVSIPK